MDAQSFRRCWRLGQGLVDAVKELRDGLLAAAAPVQYEAVNELGRHLGVSDMPPEPFTEKQRRQSRMDGGAETDDDNNLRDDVPVAPALVQPRIQRARAARQHATRRCGRVQEFAFDWSLPVRVPMV